MPLGRTLFDKVWDLRAIGRASDGSSLLWIDRHFVHEGSFHGFASLNRRELPLARPDLTFGVADHYVPTRNRASAIDSDIGRMIERLRANAGQHGFTLFDLHDRRQGIVHVIGPELGLTLPGSTIVCGDSHTSTHGAFGAIAFGIGASEVTHVLATQTLRQRKPKQMRVMVEGDLPIHIDAKDVALTLIHRIGADGAAGHMIEYTGSAIRGMSMSGRQTLCNMSIESGARCGMIAPDDITFRQIEGLEFSPKGDVFERAKEAWLQLATDRDASVDRDLCLLAADILPSVTWGVTPEDALPITATVPDPRHCTDPTRAQQITDALAYMDLQPNQKLSDIRIDEVFIGSCSNGRIEDLRSAAAVLRDKKVRVPGLVSPGSMPIKFQAEQEGLSGIFRSAGLTWGDSGCSMCVGINGDIVQPGRRCASTSNRNFKGRQGPGSRTHLMSPAMVAAAAVTGHLTDVRSFVRGV